MFDSNDQLLLNEKDDAMPDIDDGSPEFAGRPVKLEPTPDDVENGCVEAGALIC